MITRNAIAADPKALRDALDQVEKMKKGYLGHLDPSVSYMGVPLHWFDVIMAAARSTLPRTKMVEVWRVEFCVVSGDTRSAEPWRAGVWTFRERIDAKVEANKAMPPNYRCVRITGPHQQEVPA